LFASAFEERLVEFERLKQKAAHGSYEEIPARDVEVPAVDPLEYDRIG
jgi:hypothetical protein